MDSFLNNMISHWQSLKRMKNHYSDERLKAEEAIQEYLEQNNQWNPFGTMSFDGLKIRSNYRRLWDQKVLVKAKAQHNLTALQFPFVTEYKEIKTQSDYLEKKVPEIWEKISPALTVYATKPYFFAPKKGE